MPVNVRRAAAVLALLLLVWMLVLFFRQPTIDYAPDDHFGQVRAECGSVVGAGWPGDTDFLLDDNGSGPYADSIEGNTATMKQITRDGVYRDCAQRRDTYVGGMAILAVPTTLLAVVAILPRRRTVPAKA